MPLPADLLRDLGVFSLLQVPSERSTASAAGAGAAAAGSSEVPAEGMESPSRRHGGFLPVVERPVTLDLVDVEVFGFTDSTGKFVNDTD